MRLNAIGLGAFAALALWSTAETRAQTATSGVTIYGNVDAGVMRQWGWNTSKLSMDHYHTSRLGFRGNEDLGGGLSAIFKLETRFLPKNGNQQDAATLFNDETYVGLASTTLGTFKMGRTYSPFYLAVAGRIDPFNGDGVGSMTGLTSLGHNLSPGNPYDSAKGLTNRDVRTNNSLDYTSPVFGGFTLQGQTNFAEVQSKSNGRAFVVKYDSPTLFAEAGYEKKSFSYDAYSTHIGGGYVWGPAKLSVGYTTGYYSDDEYARNNRAKSAIIGLTYTISNFNILAAVSRMTMEKPTLLDAAKGTGSDLTKWAVGVDYFLSKRTKLYMHYAHFSEPISLLFVTNPQRFMVGIDTRF